MKFRIYYWDRPKYRGSDPWYSPESGSKKLNDALPAYLARLGLTPVAPEVVAPETVEMLESQWAVFVEQGVPLRDEAALLWFAKQEFLRQVKKRTVFDARHYTMRATLKAAGGVLPTSMIGFESKLSEWAEPIEKARKARVKARGEKPDPDDLKEGNRRAALKGRLHNLVEKAVLDDVKDVFAVPENAKEITPSVIVIGPANSRKIPEATLRVSRGRKRGKSAHLQLTIKTDWYRKVHKAGLAKVLGPKTFVLDADVSSNGTRLIVARQLASGLKVEKGWLSLGKNGTRILKKEKA